MRLFKVLACPQHPCHSPCSEHCPPHQPFHGIASQNLLRLFQPAPAESGAANLAEQGGTMSCTAQYCRAGWNDVLHSSVLQSKASFCSDLAPRGCAQARGGDGSACRARGTCAASRTAGTDRQTLFQGWGKEQRQRQRSLWPGQAAGQAWLRPALTWSQRPRQARQHSQGTVPPAPDSAP